MPRTAGQRARRRAQRARKRANITEVRDITRRVNGREPLAGLMGVSVDDKTKSWGLSFGPFWANNYVSGAPRLIAAAGGFTEYRVLSLKVYARVHGSARGCLQVAVDNRPELVGQLEGGGNLQGGVIGASVEVLSPAFGETSSGAIPWAPLPNPLISKCPALNHPCHTRFVLITAYNPGQEVFWVHVEVEYVVEFKGIVNTVGVYKDEVNVQGEGFSAGGVVELGHGGPVVPTQGHPATPSRSEEPIPLSTAREEMAGAIGTRQGQGQAHP